MLPVDLMYGCVSKVAPPCYSAYVLEQRWMALQSAEIVHRVTGKAVDLQSRMRDNTGLREWTFAIGDRVLYFYPPAATDKLNPTPWTGPHTVIELAETDHLVKIRKLSTGKRGRCNREPLSEQWVSSAHLKPVMAYGEEGALLTSSRTRQNKTGSVEVDALNYTANLFCTFGDANWCPKFRT